MATWDDVRRLALALPRTGEKTSWGHAMWTVAGKGFVWERPLRQSDHAALRDQGWGDAVPDGEILGVRVPDLGAKEALLADDPAVYFTTPHFDGYPSVLVRLERIDLDELSEIVTDAWLARAPVKAAAAFRAGEQPG